MSNKIYDNEEFFKSYSNMDRSKYGLEMAGEWPQFEPLIGNLEGKRVLDLGCGYGWLSKYAADSRAENITAIDLSLKMLDVAKARNYSTKIEYRCCSIEDYEYPSEEFDIVLSNLVLHYIQDLESIYKKVYRTLKGGGSFLFNMEHPVFTAGINEDWIYDEDNKPLYWPIDNYYYEGERETSFLGHKVKKEHHTLSTIINPLIHVGFKIERVEEVLPPNSMLKIPGMINEMRRPMMIIVKVQKI